MDQKLIEGAFGDVAHSISVKGMNAAADGQIALVAGIAVVLFAVLLFVLAVR